MKRLTILLTSVLLAATPLLASAAGEVNLYSARKEQLIKPLLDRFTEETGIQVNLVTGKADALLKRLETEGRSYPTHIQAPAGRTLRVPYQGRATRTTRSAVSLLELRGGAFAHDRLDRVALEDGFVELRGLEPGDYRKILIYNKDRVFAFVNALGDIGTEWGVAAAGCVKRSAAVLTPRHATSSTTSCGRSAGSSASIASPTTSPCWR